MPEIEVNVQNQNELFSIIATKFTEFTQRVYFYTEVLGVKTDRNLTADETTTFYFFVKRSSSEVVEVEGTFTAGNNYADYDFTTAKTAVDGTFTASVVISDSDDNPQVMGDGSIFFELNPGTGTSTELDTSIIVNWSSITSIGLRPWNMGNEITIISNCASSPYDVAINDAGTTFFLDESLACDFTFNLPTASNSFSSTRSLQFAFQQNNNANVMIIQAPTGETIADSSAGGTVKSVRNWGSSQIPIAMIEVRPISTTTWQIVEIYSAFETT